VSAATADEVLEVTIAGRVVHVNAEGFLTEFGEWTPEIAAELAADLGLALDEERLAVLRFVRDDFADRGTTATLRRLKAVGGFETRRLFALFPQKPAKKIAYVAGVPKPVGCV
jgi:tRNA 2-thiouridine synthesizing protein E